MLFSMVGVPHISIDCNNTPRSRHHKLQVSIVRDNIKAGGSSSSEQCMIATAETDDVKD